MRLLAFFLVICLGVSPAWAAPKLATDPDSFYLGLVKRAQSMPADFDFAQLRMAYTQTSFYSPLGFGSKQKELIGELRKADEGDSAAKNEVAKISEQHFANFMLHSIMGGYLVSKKLDPKLHTWAYAAIIKSILASGGGKTPESAFHVIEVGEEYLIARTVFRAKVTSQTLVSQNGHTYDKLSLERDGGKIDVYFNIDVAMAGYDTMLKSGNVHKLPDK